MGRKVEWQAYPFWVKKEASINWHQKELRHFGNEIRWLDPDTAEVAYVFARRFDSRHHLGLNPETAAAVERLEFDADVTTASAWLRDRLIEGEILMVVFGKDECFRCRRAFFLDHWQDLFVPGRDDAIAYAEQGETILFVCHAGESELGRRKES